MIKEMDNRAELREHKKDIGKTLREYLTEACGKKAINGSEIKILAFIKSTRILIPVKMMPAEFIQRIVEENQSKKFFYKIKFFQSGEFIEISLPDKPLLTEGFGIMAYFFHMLIQHVKSKGTKKS